MAAQNSSPMSVRVSDEARKVLKYAAIANGRSMNAELASRLESSITEEERERAAAVAKLIGSPS